MDKRKLPDPLNREQICDLYDKILKDPKYATTYLEEQLIVTCVDLLDTLETYVLGSRGFP